MLKILIVILMFIISGCSGTPEKKTKKQAALIAEEYAKGQLNNPLKEISGNGAITIGNGHRKYIIDPSIIFTGLIDEDDQIDALVTLVSYNEGRLDLIEHLIIIRINNRMIMQRSIENDMKILSINNRIITAEVPTHSRNSPLFNCRECREVVKYRYVAGEFVKAD